MKPHTVLMDLSRAEAAHLAMLVSDFLLVLEDSPESDTAVKRLLPSAYPDDDEADAEFSRLTRDDLLASRRADARAVLDTIGEVDESVLDSESAHDVLPIAIAAAQLPAWMRTLTALRLVLADRMGIVDDEDQPVDDPRYGVYEWLAYRLDQLVSASGPGRA